VVVGQFRNGEKSMRTTKNAVRAFLASCALLCVFGQYDANATFVYSTQSSFLSAVTPVAFYPVNLNDFSSLNGTIFNSLSYSGVGYDYTITPGSPPPRDYLFAVAPGNNKAISTYAGSDLVITFAGPPVIGVGGNFFASDINGNLVSGTVRVTLSDGTQVTIPTSGSLPYPFLGFSTTGPYITSVDVEVIGGNYPTLDNFYVASVPEAATVLTDCVLLLAVGAGAFYYRRGKATKAQVAA
jgi:hypothetical protein